MITSVVFHERFLDHVLSPGHPESPARLQVVLEQLETSGLMDNPSIRLIQPSPAEQQYVTRVHAEEYIERLRLASSAGGAMFTLDTTSNQHTYEAAMLAAGGGVMAVDEVLSHKGENAFLLCRPPGHHAEYAHALGFCFVNNIAVAASHLTHDCGLQRVMIVDYDAHHGNGTQAAFYSSKEVLYLGIHQDGRTLFPGTGFEDEIGTEDGTGYNVNVPLYPGAGDVSYEVVLDEVVGPVADAFRPEFVLVSAGFDCHFADPLTNLGLSLQGIALINHRLVQIADRHAHGRIVFFLEGGYNLVVVARGAQNLVEELARIEVTPFEDEVHESGASIDHTKSLVQRIVDRLSSTLLY